MSHNPPGMPLDPVSGLIWHSSWYKYLVKLLEKIMTQNDELSNTLLNVERAVNTLLPEIQSEISDLAARMGGLTDPQAQDLVDRMNALNAKVSNAVTALQADNPTTPPPAGGASAHTRERDR